MDLIDGDNVGLSIQDTAYAAGALFAVGGQLRSLATDLVGWLVSRQEPWGGWLAEGVQYPHVNAEVMFVLAAHIGRRGRGERSTGPALKERDFVRWRATTSHDPVEPFDGE